MALQLPLTVAVAAHYHAAPGSPRLVLFDELFAGVDERGRRDSFKVLDALRLDLMVTSESEWCTYPEVPGIAIHQIQGDKNDPAVTSTRWVWNGVGLQEQEALL